MSAAPGCDEASPCNLHLLLTRQKEDEAVCGWSQKRLWIVALKTAESRSPETENEVWLETGWSTHHWRGRRECEETDSCPGTAGWMAPWSKCLADQLSVSAVQGNNCHPTVVWECGGRRKGGKETVCSLQSDGSVTLPGEVSRPHLDASEVSLVL